MTTMPTREEQLDRLLDKIEAETQEETRASDRGDHEAATRHRENAKGSRNAITLQLRILERKLEARP